MQAPRLLVLAPLRVEAIALGPGATSRVGPAVLEVERIGMGLRKAGDAAQPSSEFRSSASRFKDVRPGRS